MKNHIVIGAAIQVGWTVIVVAIFVFAKIMENILVRNAVKTAVTMRIIRMLKNEGPDGYDPIHDIISNALFVLLGAIMLGCIAVALWALYHGVPAHAATVRHTPHPHVRPHFHYDVPPVYGKKMADDVPYVGFTTDLLRELRCCHALEQ